jgi:hypothetical protein
VRNCYALAFRCVACICTCRCRAIRNRNGRQRVAGLGSGRARFGLATNYFGTIHPSEGNYVSLVGGDDYNIQDDAPYQTHQIAQPSIVDQLEQAQLTWKGYFQNLPVAGFAGNCFPSSADCLDAPPLPCVRIRCCPFDEGDSDLTCCDSGDDPNTTGGRKVVTVVIRNHQNGPLQDPTPYNHHSLAATLQEAFGLGCTFNGQPVGRWKSGRDTTFVAADDWTRTRGDRPPAPR